MLSNAQSIIKKLLTDGSWEGPCKVNGAFHSIKKSRFMTIVKGAMA